MFLLFLLIRHYTLPIYLLLWAAFAQITKHAHTNTAKCLLFLYRLRVNCVGMFDVLTFDNSQTNHLALMPQYQVLNISLHPNIVCYAHRMHNLSAYICI